MTNETGLIPSSNKANLFAELGRNLFHRNCRYVDYNGKIGYLAYPPKKGFSPKQCEEIRSLEISGVETIDDKTDPKDDLRHLRFLEKLTLGDSVKTISRYSIPTTVSTIVLPEGISIPESHVAMGSYTKISMPGVTFDSKYANYSNSFFTDEFGRLHFTKSSHLSSNEVDVIDRSGKNLQESVSALRNTSAESLLHHSSKYSCDKTIYVYAKSINSNKNYSIHAVADTFPMPEEHKTELSDDTLIAIMVNETQELDLTTLETYPNLQTIYVGKSVDKVTGVKEEYTGGTDGRGHKQILDLSKSGKKQSIILLSNNTVPIATPKTKTSEPTIEQSEQIIENGKDIEL